MLKYTIMMTIRVICIALCLVVKGWWLILPAAGAILLPYLAVVVANTATTGRRAKVARPGAIVTRAGNERP